MESENILNEELTGCSPEIPLVFGRQYAQKPRRDYTHITMFDCSGSKRPIHLQLTWLIRIETVWVGHNFFQLSNTFYSLWQTYQCDFLFKSCLRLLIICRKWLLHFTQKYGLGEVCGSINFFPLVHLAHDADQPTDPRQRMIKGGEQITPLYLNRYNCTWSENAVTASNACLRNGMIKMKCE